MTVGVLGGPLARLESAHQLLAEARDVDEVKHIIDLAEAARVYARQARLGLEAQNFAAEIKLRAERRAGELFAALPRDPGGRPAGLQRNHDSGPTENSFQAGTSFQETLRDADVSRTQAHRWQKIASVPEPIFEQHISASKSYGRELTTADTLRLAPRVVRPIVLDMATMPTVSQCAIDQADAAKLPLADASVDLIVTSPPYGLAIDYEDSDDDQGYTAYMELVQTWSAELYRVATPQGRLCLNVPLDITRGGTQPIYADWLERLRAAGWRYRCTIVWNEGTINKSTARGSVDSPGSPHVIAPVEVVIVAHKGEWNLHRIGVHTLEHEQWLEWTNGLWTFGGEHRRDHPAPYPEELPRRCISLFSFSDAVVCDPFVGSGTTAVVAYKLGRQFYGYDQSAQYIAQARARVAQEIAA